MKKEQFNEFHQALNQFWTMDCSNDCMESVLKKCLNEAGIPVFLIDHIKLSGAAGVHFWNDKHDPDFVSLEDMTNLLKRGAL